MIVVAVAIVVVSAGGAAPAMAAAGGGTFTCSTVTAIAAGFAVMAGTALAAMAIDAISTSQSLDQFAQKGNWGTVGSTVFAGIIGGIIGGLSAHSSNKGSNSSSSGRETQNPKVRAAIEKGQAMHKQMNYGPGTQKEVGINPRCRVDGIDFKNRIIYELKPNNPQAIARGLRQLDIYKNAAGEQYGGEWTGVLKLYD